MNGLDIASALLRGAHLAALCSLFGTLVFAAVVVRTLPATGWARVAQGRLARLGRGSVTLALALGVAWFVVRSAGIAGTHGLGDTLAGLPLVALETRFGQLLLVRFGLLLALVPLCSVVWGRPSRTGIDRLALTAAIFLAGGALGLQAATSHAGAMAGVSGQSLMIAETLHVAAAGAWLGGLVPLWICLATMPKEAAALALRRFFPLGLVTVSIIAATSVMQAIYLVGSVPALVGTAYGRVALLKLFLFLLLMGFAALNRFVFSARPGRRLRRSIIGETAPAILVLLAAGSLAHLTPGTHAQADWPFPWRVNPNPAGRLFIAAYPTSFFVSPTGFAAAAILRGERVYQAACASCHGASGQGDGPAARALAVAPADLTARRLLEHSDGDLFWFVGHEVAAPDADRWDLIDYLRARNRGEFVRTSGRGLHPLQIPRFTAVCADGRVIDLDDLRGQVLRIVVPAGSQPEPTLTPASTHLTTITLPPNAASRPDAAACLAPGEVLKAFAILLGTTPEALAGSQFLIDPNGWLRARWRPGEPGGWGTSERLFARTEALAKHALPDRANGQAHRH